MFCTRSVMRGLAAINAGSTINAAGAHVAFRLILLASRKCSTLAAQAAHCLLAYLPGQNATHPACGRLCKFEDSSILQMHSILPKLVDTSRSQVQLPYLSYLSVAIPVISHGNAAQHAWPHTPPLLPVAIMLAGHVVFAYLSSGRTRPRTLQVCTH